MEASRNRNEAFGARVLIVIIVCKAIGALTSIPSTPTVRAVMNTAAPTFAAAAAFDGSADASGEQYGSGFFYSGFAHLYFYSRAGDM